MMNRNVGSRQEATLLMRTAVDGVLEEIGTNPTVVQKGVAFRGCPITSDGFALAFDSNHELQQLPLGSFDLFCKRKIGLNAAQPCGFFSISKTFHSRSLSLGSVFVMASENPQRSTVGWQFLNVKHP